MRDGRFGQNAQINMGVNGKWRTGHRGENRIRSVFRAFPGRSATMRIISLTCPVQKIMAYECAIDLHVILLPLPKINMVFWVH
jgi:hypothetical protein